MKTVGAIDIGSNSILLTIAEPGVNQSVPLRLLVDEAHVTGLSKGLSKGASITDEAKVRAYKVLKHYSEILKEYRIQEFKVIATEALRRAKNGLEVQKDISEIFSAPVEIISGDREAELSFWSVQKEFSDPRAKKIIFDIGGASTELCLGNDQGIEKSVSVKVGSVVLTEKFGLQNKCSPHPAKDYVISLLREVPWLEKMENTLGIGVAGTMTTLMAMEKKISTYDRKLVHTMSITREKVNHWMSEVCSRDSEDRPSLMGLPADRADVFSGGVIIVNALVDYIGWKNLICMDAGVRLGIIYEMLKI